MPIRGRRNPFPQKAESPSGIFSTNGKQKQDGQNGPHKDVLNYSLGNSNDMNGQKLTGQSGKQGLRHQSPKSRSY